MRNNAIIRIIIFSIVIVILLGILLAGLGFGALMTHLNAEKTDYSTARAPTVLFPLEEVRNIQIDWAAGNIEIIAGDVDSIQVTESGSFSEQEAMAYKQAGETLYIRFKKETVTFDTFSVAHKDLTVTVPRDWVCQKLTLDVASANITVDTLTASYVNLNTASSDSVFKACHITDLDVNTASGSVEYQGILNTLDCDAASGRFTGVFDNTPSAINMDSASGDLDITLPRDSGFRVEMDALSGRFTTDFPVTTRGDSYIHGDCACEIEYDGVSGNVMVLMG